MQTETARYLFVYGTLMSGAGTALGKSQRLRLARESDSLGPASIAHAHLYDLGHYPGAIAAGGIDDLVHGEAVVFSAPERTLAWLDAYEGVMPGNRDASEYDRTLREVRLAGGETIDAWVYLLRAVPAHGRRIEDGRWMPRLGGPSR
jgi:gamma-glutamylcyclotransferase (GGCT)/AIG2-like uncharacterized protein YtfP